MPQVNVIPNLQEIGESLFRVNNLAAHMGIEIRALQFNLTKAISDLEGIESKEGAEPTILLDDTYLTDAERNELHALNTTITITSMNLDGVQKRRQEIIQAVMKRTREAEGGQDNE